MTGGFEIAVFVGWFLALCGCVSSPRRAAPQGYCRWRWALINVLGFVPYVVIFTAGSRSARARPARFRETPLPYVC
jgi:hypothetical protein